MDTSSTGVTVMMTAAEVTPERLTLISVVPSERDVNNPLEANALLMVPIPAFDELQATRDVRS